MGEEIGLSPLRGLGSIPFFLSPVGRGGGEGGTVFPSSSGAVEKHEGLF